MMIELILTENVKNKGYIGDIIRVRLGYARNFLLKKGLALPKNAQNLKLLDQLNKKKMAILAKEKADAEAIAKILNEKEIKLTEKVHDDIQLYGSISASDLAQLIKEKFEIEIDKKKIKLPNQQSHIKTSGSYDIQIALYPEVVCALKLIITPEEEPKKTEKSKKSKKNEKAEEKSEKAEEKAEKTVEPELAVEPEIENN